MNCHECGTPSAGGSFCVNCGTSFQAAPPTTTSVLQPTDPPSTPPTTAPTAGPFTPAPTAAAPEAPPVAPPVAPAGVDSTSAGVPSIGGPAGGGPGAIPPHMAQNQPSVYPAPAYPTPTTPTASAGGMPPAGYSAYPNGAYLPAGPPPKKGLSTGAIWAIVSASVVAVLVVAVGIFAVAGIGDGEEEVAAPGSSSTLDTLWLACSGGDFQACDDLYFEAPFGSDYKDFGDSCGNRNEPAGYCVDIYGSASGSSSAPRNLGNDPVLDQLADRCANGDFGACDDLFWQSPLDSDYEDFGARCGDRNERAANQCVTLYGAGTGSGSSSTGTGEYGSDAALDRLWDSCSNGNFVACDDLFFQSPSGSTYRYFGDTCGLRNEPAGLCESIYG